MERLIAETKELIAKGVHNLNFVTPEHWWPHIQQLCEAIRQDYPELPFVWNSSGYSRVEMLREQTKIIDIFLPDFKFSDPNLSQRCIHTTDYPSVARDAIRYLVDAVGFLRPFDETGEITASRGVMVRHLVLPGFVENSLQILEWLYDDFGPKLPISIMSQFTPVPACAEQDFLNRRLTKDEYQQVCDKVDELGFTRVFLQPDFGDDAFMPDFNDQQPFEGNKNRI